MAYTPTIGRGGFSPSAFKPPGVAKAGAPKLGGKTIGQWWGVGNPVAQAAAGAANWTATSNNPQNVKSQAAGAPSNPPASVTAPSSSGSPLDSTYFQNVAQNQFAVNNHVNALNLQQSQDQTALQTALANLAYQQPRDQLALEQRANQGGGLYSSVENMNQANLVHGYATRQTAAQSNYNNQASKIAAQIAALRGGIPLFNEGQAEASGQRAALAALNNPALTAPAAPVAAPVAPAAARAPAKSAGKTGKGGGVGSAGSALQGALGVLTRGRASVGSAGGALSNRQKLTNQLAKGRK